METIRLSLIFNRYKGKILLTYLLFTLEFLLFLAGPFVLGIAIDGLLKGSYHGIWIFISQHLAHLLVSRLRRLYNIRVFTGIYNKIVLEMITLQKKAKMNSSSIVAKATLTKDLINFFEHDLTSVFNSIYSIVGSLIILGAYDWGLFSSCLLLIAPCTVINYRLNKKNRLLYKVKNTELEKQVQILQFEPINKIQDHYTQLAKWDIRLSDVSALNFTIMEFFVLGLMVFTLIYYCGKHPEVSSGTILSVFQYLIKFVIGLDYVPILNNQFANIKDIQRRIETSATIEISDQNTNLKTTKMQKK